MSAKRWVSGHDLTRQGAIDHHQFLLMVAVLGVLVVVLIQGLVNQSPNIYWDVDPSSDTATAADIRLGPRGISWLHVLSVAIAAVAMAVHVLRGGRIRWVDSVLILIGTASCAWHMPEHFLSMLHCGAWIASASLVLAVVHLAEHEKARRWLAVALVAMLVPLAIKSAWWVWAEHPDTVNRMRDQFIQDLGWQLGSPEHGLFERRMKNWAIVGVFGLSNVFGSIVLAYTTIALALALGQLRQSLKRACLPLILVLAGLAMVVGTRSKGVMGSMVIAVVLLMCLWRSIGHVRFRTFLGVTAIALLVLVIGAVIARGLIGPPPTRRGNISLLVRSQYWEAAVRIVKDDPVRNVLLGTGPAPFAQAYLQHKNPLNPEEVTSSHNVFIDWIAMLGIGGWAWTVLILIWLWRGGRNAANALLADEEEESKSRSWPSRVDVRWGVAVSLLLFVPQYLVLYEGMGPDSALLWLIGLGGFAATLIFLATPGWSPRKWIDVGLFVAATALLLHNQIDMTFFQIGSTAMAWFIVAIGGARQEVKGTRFGPEAGLWCDRKKLARLVFPGAMLIGAGVMGCLYAIPISTQQMFLSSAAEAYREGRYEDSLLSLSKASLEVRDPLIHRKRTRLLMAKAEKLAKAGQKDETRKVIGDAMRVLDRALEERLDPVAMLRQKARLEQRAAELLNEDDRINVAISYWRQVLQRTPYRLRDHLELADLLWQLARREDAQLLYEECLKLSEQSYLDPVHQLQDQDRARVVERLGAFD